MPSIVSKIPIMTDEDLLNLFRNAIAKCTQGPNEAAQLVKVAVEREWKNRLDRARAGNVSVASPNVGLLATLGYRVGSVKGEKTSIRRMILHTLLKGNCRW